MMKCSVCQEEKYEKEFCKNKSAKSGFDGRCLTCISIKNKIYHQKYKEKILLRKKEDRQENKEKFIKRNKANRIKFRDRIREWERLRRKFRRQTDMAYRLKINLRSRVYCTIKKQRGIKSAKTLDLVGCSGDFLISYLEKQFSKGMSWENYGKGHNKWNIDHRTPLCKFNLKNKKDQKRANHYTNLQPMWEIDNLKKGGKIY